ncbi:MAG TPA: LLM class flavin-dependent oxidoreductase [Frankiaceae bacterium]|nr:LLM class flavin-dependent oxidoreductase [Frankiaceae bacterium]
MTSDAAPLPTRFGAFVAPYHDPAGNPTLQLRRDLELAVLLDELGYDEVWFGEHHSGAYEMSASPEVMIAAAGERTQRIMLGTGVNSLTYHHPFVLADRIVQLDHLTRGRVMLGMGPGQLPSDAFMMGIDPLRQRDMMIEAAEVIVRLLRGEIVSAKTDWFTLDDARLQLRPYAREGIELAVASTSSPSGATLAGRLGLAMLSLSATDPSGFDALDANWGHFTRTSEEHGNPVDRNRWRVVASMHIAETREKAELEMEHGVLALNAYMERMGNRKLPWTGSAREALTHWTTNGLPNFGIATVGTPDDAIATIERLSTKTGGFGTFLFLSHNSADWQATRRSYELFAEYVIPACRGMNINRNDSIDWVGQNSECFFGAMQQATREAIAKYGRADD